MISIIIWISISLSDYYYSTYKLPLAITDVPENYAPSSRIPEYVTVKVKAEGWTLLPLEFGSQKYFVVSAKNDSSKLVENLMSAIQLNNWFNNKMNVIEISPKTITVNIEPKIEKMLKVTPILDLYFKKGYGLASEVEVFPDSILTKGPASEIRNLTEIQTEEIKLKNLDKPVKVISNVKSYRSFEININNVEVFLDVQRIIENTISGIPIKIENLPNDVEIVLIPNTINVTLRGGIEYFSKISNEDILAKLYYQDIISDTLGYLKPYITLPKNFSLISAKPEVVKYIIKKY